MSDPERLAYWQDRYIQYRKAANKHVVRANAKFLGTTSDKHRITLFLSISTFPNDFRQNPCIYRKKVVTLQPKVAKVHENGAVTDYT